MLTTFTFDMLLYSVLKLPGIREGGRGGVQIGFFLKSVIKFYLELRLRVCQFAGLWTNQKYSEDETKLVKFKNIQSSLASKDDMKWSIVSNKYIKKSLARKTTGNQVKRLKIQTKAFWTRWRWNILTGRGGGWEQAMRYL